jgi:hypothetical protein
MRDQRAAERRDKRRDRIKRVCNRRFHGEHYAPPLTLNLAPHMACPQFPRTQNTHVQSP